MLTSLNTNDKFWFLHLLFFLKKINEGVEDCPIKNHKIDFFNVSRNSASENQGQDHIYGTVGKAPLNQNTDE